MIIRRYWRVAVFAPFVGFLIAAIVAVVMTNGGSGETEYRFWFVVRSMANYGLIGMVIGAVAVVGGLVFVAMFDRRLTKSRRLRTLLSAVGASAGVVLFSAVIATALSFMDAAAYAGITIALGVVFGAAASVVAALMVLYAERQSHSRKTN